MKKQLIACAVTLSVAATASASDGISRASTDALDLAASGSFDVSTAGGQMLIDISGASYKVLDVHVSGTGDANGKLLVVGDGSSQATLSPTDEFLSPVLGAPSQDASEASEQPLADIKQAGSDTGNKVLLPIANPVGDTATQTYKVVEISATDLALLVDEYSIDPTVEVMMIVGEVATSTGAAAWEFVSVNASEAVQLASAVGGASLSNAAATFTDKGMTEAADDASKASGEASDVSESANLADASTAGRNAAANAKQKRQSRMAKRALKRDAARARLDQKKREL